MREELFLTLKLLRLKLLSINHLKRGSSLFFQADFFNDKACAIFDEVKIDLTNDVAHIDPTCSVLKKLESEASATLIPLWDFIPQKIEGGRYMSQLEAPTFCCFRSELIECLPSHAKKDNHGFFLPDFINSYAMLKENFSDAGRSEFKNIRELEDSARSLRSLSRDLLRQALGPLVSETLTQRVEALKDAAQAKARKNFADLTAWENLISEAARKIISVPYFAETNIALDDALTEARQELIRSTRTWTLLKDPLDSAMRAPLASYCAVVDPSKKSKHEYLLMPSLVYYAYMDLSEEEIERLESDSYISRGYGYDSIILEDGDHYEIARGVVDLSGANIELSLAKLVQTTKKL